MKKGKYITALMILIAITVSACSWLSGRKLTDGELGNLFSETKSLDRYTRIDFEGLGEIELVQGDTHSLKIEASQAVLEKIIVKQEGETLYVGFNQSFWKLPSDDRLVFTFTFEDLKDFEMAGGSKITARGLSTDTLNLDFEGGFIADLGELDIENLNVSIEGGGKLTATGKAATQDVKISGAGTYQLEEVESQDVNLKIEGAGNARVWTSNTLNLELEGAYAVEYWGKPVVTQHTSGIVSLKDMGEK